MGTRGQAGGGCGLASGEKAAQYLAAQQVAQPTAGPGGVFLGATAGETGIAVVSSKAVDSKE